MAVCLVFRGLYEDVSGRRRCKARRDAGAPDGQSAATGASDERRESRRLVRRCGEPDRGRDDTRARAGKRQVRVSLHDGGGEARIDRKQRSVSGQAPQYDQAGQTDAGRQLRRCVRRLCAFAGPLGGRGQGRNRMLVYGSRSESAHVRRDRRSVRTGGRPGKSFQRQDAAGRSPDRCGERPDGGFAVSADRKRPFVPSERQNPACARRVLRSGVAPGHRAVGIRGRGEIPVPGRNGDERAGPRVGRRESMSPRPTRWPMRRHD